VGEKLPLVETLDFRLYMHINLYNSGFESVRRAYPGGHQRASGEAQREKKITRNSEI